MQVLWVMRKIISKVNISWGGRKDKEDKSSTQHCLLDCKGRNLFNSVFAASSGRRCMRLREYMPTCMSIYKLNAFVFHPLLASLEAFHLCSFFFFFILIAPLWSLTLCNLAYHKLKINSIFPKESKICSTWQHCIFNDAVSWSEILVLSFNTDDQLFVFLG